MRGVIEMVQLADVCPVCASIDQALARLPASKPGGFDSPAEGVESAETEPGAGP